MARKLKVYSTTLYGNPGGGIAEALGTKQRMFRAVVAAYTHNQARLLVGQHTADWSHSGRITSYQEFIDVAMTAPGQVFVGPYDFRKADDPKFVPAGVTADRRFNLVHGVVSTLELGDELVARDLAEKKANKEQIAARKQEAEDQYERRAQTRQAIQETLTRLLPALESLGVNPQTVSEGSAGSRLGVLIPAEAIEEVVRLALIGNNIKEM